MLYERAIDCDKAPEGRTKHGRPARSVTVNIAESPLGWLYSRNLVTRRQLDAGEQLRTDWEQAQLAARVTWLGTPR